jgi:hypothetical protein
MAEDGFGSERERGRHPPGFHRPASVSHGVDASMKAIEPAMGDARLDHLVGQPDIPELPPSHDTVLTSRHPRDLSVKSLRVKFWVLSTQKVTRVFHGADADSEIRTCGAQFVPT